MTPFDVIGDLWLAEYEATVKQIHRSGIAADAEDVATEVFLELADRITAGVQSTDPEELLKSLRVTASRRAKDAHREASQVERLLAALSDLLPPAPIAAPRPDSFMASSVNDVLHELPRLHAQTFILAVLRGCSAYETAILIGVHRDTVYRWIDSASTELQRRLTP